MNTYIYIYIYMNTTITNIIVSRKSITKRRHIYIYITYIWAYISLYESIYKIYICTYISLYESIYNIYMNIYQSIREYIYIYVSIYIYIYAHISVYIRSAFCKWRQSQSAQSPRWLVLTEPNLLWLQWLGTQWTWMKLL